MNKEMIRRICLILGLLLGIWMYFYTMPAAILVRHIDWSKEQMEELSSPYPLVTNEAKRLASLPLQSYIMEKTQGNLYVIDKVPLALQAAFEEGQFSVDGSQGLFFKTSEIPYDRWGIPFPQTESVYISTPSNEQFFQLSYVDFVQEVNPFHTPSLKPPESMYHPLRVTGIILAGIGLLLYLFIPKRKLPQEAIYYSQSSISAGDIASVLLVGVFFAMPLMINGGSLQAFQHMWQVTAIFFALTLLGLLIIWYQIKFSSYYIIPEAQGLYIQGSTSVTQIPYESIVQVEAVNLRNPAWFRKSFLLMALLSGGNYASSAGMALLSDSASYRSLEIQSKDRKPYYIWFSNQGGGIILQNFDHLISELENHGIQIISSNREIEGFAFLK